MGISKQVTTALLLALISCRWGGANEHSLPFELVGGLVYLEARINDSDRLAVVLDTGASVSTISPSAAQRIQLKTASSIQAAGPGRGSEESLAVASGVRINIGPIELKNQNIAVLPVDYIAIQAGHATDGILSVGAFARQVVEVDYGAKRVHFFDAPGYSPPRESVEVAITVGGNVPFVRAEIGLPGGGTATGTFLLDSGLTRTILFSKPFLGHHPELLQAGDRIDLPPVEAVGGKMEMKAGRIEFLRLGPFTFKHPIASFTLNGAGILDNPQIDGIIGTEILERFRVAYDYSRNRMFLTPGPLLDQAFDADASGLKLVTDPPDFHRFRVAAVLGHSAAAEVDIRQGDTLMAVDGKRAADLTLSQLREMFKLPDREYSLSIERGQERLTVRLKTRRLI